MSPKSLAHLILEPIGAGSFSLEGERVRGSYVFFEKILAKEGR